MKFRWAARSILRAITVAGICLAQPALPQSGVPFAKNPATSIASFSSVAVGQSGAPAKTLSPPRAATAPQKAAGPSLEETTSWIKAALASYGHVQRKDDYHSGTLVTHDFTNTLISADGCKLSFVHLYTAYTATTINPFPSSSTPQEQTIVLNLRDFDPTTAKLTEQPAGSDQYANYSDSGVLVGFQTTNLAKSVEVTEKSSAPTGQPVYWSAISLRVSSKDAATRLMKAMSHAIALCGGKKSTF
jgi:hypothetical protein